MRTTSLKDQLAATEGEEADELRKEIKELEERIKRTDRVPDCPVVPRIIWWVVAAPRVARTFTRRYVL